MTLNTRLARSRMIRARVSVALVVTFVVLLAILHVLEPQMNSGHLISESS
jgi:hypothetical protein